MSLPDHIVESKSYLLNEGVSKSPDAAVILGSGLGSFAGEIEDPISIPYSRIPHFPVTSVEGHDGTLLSGTVNGHSVLAFSGRFHHYEGFTFEQAALPVYLSKSLGASKLIISNAAGGINTSFEVGDLMVIEDVMRQNMAVSPLGRDRYRYRYRHYPQVKRVRALAAALGIPVRQGSYLYVTGPNYETKAEIRAFRIMGADAVGMSTAPELMEAARLELRAVAISLISNMATGVLPGRLSHEEVTDAAASRRADFSRLVKKLIAEL
ncbi:MAG: purine-nucleoside phosphorylase [Balneolaceae bacterium]|nr:purine-nucleoside phosphorylase [Balneolaceae bacterium]